MYDSDKWQNVIKHLKGRFKHNDDWTNFIGVWWKIIFRDDEDDHLTFDAEWAMLVGHLPDECRGGDSLGIFQKHYGGPSFMLREELGEGDEMDWTLVDMEPETREVDDDYVLVSLPQPLAYEWDAQGGLRVVGQFPLPNKRIEGAHRPHKEKEKKERQAVEDERERNRVENQRAMESGVPIVLTTEEEATYCNAAAAYVDKLYNLRMLYCRRWTHEYPGCGAHSTQRAESIHNAVKGLLNTRVPISELPPRIERTCNHAKDKHSALTFIANWTLELKPLVQAEFLQSVKHELTKYAFTYLSKEYFQAVNYTVKDVDGSTDVLIVCRNNDNSERTLDGDHEFVDGLRLDPNTYLRRERRVYLVEGFPELCSCQAMTFMGLFCRHMFQVIIVKQQQQKFKDMVLALSYPRWLKSNNGDNANVDRAIDALAAKSKYKPAFVDSTLDPLDAVPVEKRYAYVMQLAKQIASRASLRQDRFKHVVHTFDGMLRGMSGFSEGGTSEGDAPATKRAKPANGAGPNGVLNPVSGRGPGRPKSKREGMNGCREGGAGPGRPSAAAATAAATSKGKASQMGSRGGQRRFKSSVEMSKMQRTTVGSKDGGNRGKGKRPAAD